MRLNPWIGLVVFAIVGLCMSTCEARGAGGGARGGARGGGGNFNTEPVEVPAVEFSQNIPEATEVAVKEDKPFLIFFCTEEMSKVAGTGSVAIAEYRKSLEGKPPAGTPLDEMAVVDALNRSGYKIVKVIAAPQTVAVAKKYKVSSAPALVACTPTDDVIGLLQGPAFSQTNVLNLLKNLKATYAQWKTLNPDKDPAKQAANVAAANNQQANPAPDQTKPQENAP